MSQELPVLARTFPANADFTGKRYHIVKLLTTGRVDIAGANEDSIGVLQKDEASAQDVPSSVSMLGTIKVKADGSVTPIVIGDRLKSNASGIAVKGGAGADKNLLRALEASSAANDIIEAFFERIVT